MQRCQPLTVKTMKPKRKRFTRQTGDSKPPAPKVKTTKPEPQEPTRERLVIHVLPETARQIEQEAGTDPLGCAVDRLLAKPRPEPSQQPARPIFGRLATIKIESEAEILARLNNPQFKTTKKPL
jgi:hypothetical protein